MDFVAIDFETANSYRGSACALGVVEYKNNQKVREWHWYIKPKSLKFDYFNSQLHGITIDDVIDKPEFDEIYNSELKEILEGKLVIAHFANFDLSVLRLLIKDYNLEHPNFKCICTYEYSRRAIKNLLSYGLFQLTSKFNIQLEHHNPLSDANACASLFILFNSENNIASKEALFDAFFLKPYLVNTSGFHGKNLLSEGEISINTESPFYQKEVVFTGKIELMSRVEAQQLIQNIGGIAGKGVTLKTSFLVIGGYDSIKYGFDFKSTKILKAEKYIENGQQIEILNEDEFMRML